MRCTPSAPLSAPLPGRVMTTCWLTVKGNQPRLRTALKALPWKNIPAHHSTITGHGRRVRRTIKVCQVPDWIDWPGARQVAQLRRTRTIDGRKTVWGWFT